MLKSLSIRNYLLINHLDIEFQPGLTIITGETGAGKSILLGALNLILGQRADASVLKAATEKCFIEGQFNIENYNLEALFENNDIDYEPLLILRREITTNGKSRAFVNDTPVNLSVLKEIGDQLIDIHSQHESLNMGNNRFQMQIVDNVARLDHHLKEYSSIYQTYKNLNRELEHLIGMAEKNKADLDYYQFQHEQLKQSKLIPGEEIELEREQKTLAHAEEIKSGLANTLQLLNGEDEGTALQQINLAAGLIQKLTSLLPEAEEISRRLESAGIEINDISQESSRLQERIEIDPSRLEFVNERLNTLYNLMQKHKADSVDALINIEREYEEKIAEIDSFEHKIEEVSKALEQTTKQLTLLASILSTERNKIKPVIEEKVRDLLTQLGIANAKFTVNIISSETFTDSGTDRVEFLFSANKQSVPQEIGKVASGGELSRLMLAIKSLQSQSASLPTIIFDEIDSGVSGEIADKMGKIILSMSNYMQVINITHLPQIAAKGNNHFLVYKENTTKATITGMRLLTDDERITEVAKMLSGEELTQAALQNAKELLRS